MKKILVLNTLLVIVAMFFMSCQNSTSGSNDEPDIVTDKVELADGNWTAKCLQKTKVYGYNVDAELYGKFTALNNVGTAKSGTISYKMKTAELLGNDYIAYTQMTPAQKEAYSDAYKNYLTSSLSYMGTVKTATIDDTNVTIVIDMNSSYLSDFNSMLNFNKPLVSGTVIKTNSNKTKYEITIPQAQNKTITYILTKD